MTNEQREAIRQCELYVQAKATIQLVDEIDGKLAFKSCDTSAIDTVLSLIKEQQEKIELIKEYAHQEIAHYTETIKDYRDDDKEENEHYIEELKEEREHWRDIEKIIQNKPKEELYMNWWKYGLYE